jgi:long-chain acyl-CoA synthetase
VHPREVVPSGAKVASIFDRHADSPFLLDAIAGRAFTYAEVDGLAGRFAHELRSRGVDRGDRVALILPNSVELAVLYFACLRLGAVAVPMSVDTPAGDAERALRHARVKVVIGEEDLGALAEAQDGVDPVEGVGDADDLFSITFTSGTTATPKGVAHRAASLLGAASAFADSVGFTAQDRFLHTFPMTYMAGFLNALLCPFVVGASVVLAPAFDGRSLLRFWKPVLEHEVTILWLTPTIVASLLRVDRDPTGAAYARKHVRAASVATAPLSRSHQLVFEERYGTRLFESYGLSELLFVTTTSPHAPDVAESVGRPLPGVEIATDDSGEVLVRTEYAMAGYVDEHGEPDPETSPEWFPTGDIGHVDENGLLFITGRKKDVIIRGGLNVSPRAVEELLQQHPAVDEAVVVGVPHDVLGEEIVAVLILAEGRSLKEELESLTALCRAGSSVGAQPARFVAVDSFPRNETGKVRKADVRASLLNDDER